MGRRHGEGSLHFRHDWKQCPPAADRAADGSHAGRCYGVWVGQVDLGFKEDGKRDRPTVSAKSKKEANKKLNELKDRIRETGVAPAKTITLENWLRYWLADICKRRPNTKRSYRTAIETHIIPALGRKRVDKLTAQDVRTFLAGEKIAKLGSTRRIVHVVLNQALQDAKRDNRTPRNVMDFIEPPNPKKRVREALPTSEARTVLSYAARVDDDGRPVDRLGSRWATALLTGQRQGECLGLEWDRVDWDAELVDMSWQQQRLYHRHGCGDRGTDGTHPCGRTRAGNCPQRVLDVEEDYEYRHIEGAMAWVRPKSAAGMKVIPLIPIWRSALEQRHKLYVAEREHYGTDHGLVWCRRDGRPIDPSDDNKAWHQLLQAARVTDLELHSARHTTATLLLEAGIDARIVAELLGQSTVLVTRGYMHVDRSLLKRAMLDAIEKPLGIQP